MLEGSGKAAGSGSREWRRATDTLAARRHEHRYHSLNGLVQHGPKSIPRAAWASRRP